MEEQEIDKLVREHYLAQKLPELSVQRILDQGSANKKVPVQWWKYWVPVAAAAAIVMAFTFQFTRQQQSEEYYFDVAGEIAMRHNGGFPFDVQAASFEEAQVMMDRLQFELEPHANQRVLAAYEILGGRYCRVMGQQTAHLRVRHRDDDRICSLFVVLMEGRLEGFQTPGDPVDIAKNHVDMWEDSGRLFALVD